MKFEVYEPRKAEVEEVKPMKLELVSDDDGCIYINVVDEDGKWMQSLADISSDGIYLYKISDEFITKYDILVDGGNRITCV